MRGANWFSRKPVHSSSHFSGHVWARSAAENSDSFWKECETLCSKASSVQSVSLSLRGVSGGGTGDSFTRDIVQVFFVVMWRVAQSGACCRSNSRRSQVHGSCGRSGRREEERSTRAVVGVVVLSGHGALVVPIRALLDDVKTLKREISTWVEVLDLVHSGCHFGPTDIKYRHVDEDEPRFAQGVRQAIRGQIAFIAERGNGAMPTVLPKCIRSHRTAESSDFSRTCWPGVGFRGIPDEWRGAGPLVKMESGYMVGGTVTGRGCRCQEDGSRSSESIPGTTDGHGSLVSSSGPQRLKLRSNCCQNWPSFACRGVGQPGQKCGHERTRGRRLSAEQHN